MDESLISQIGRKGQPYSSATTRQGTFFSVIATVPIALAMFVAAIVSQIP
jgi:hypothetical protein